MTTKISVILMALAITAIHSLPQGYYQQYYQNPSPNYNYNAQQYYPNGYNQMQGNYYPQGNPAPAPYYAPQYNYQPQIQKGYPQPPQRANPPTSVQVPTGPVWPGAGWGENHYVINNKVNTTTHSAYDVGGQFLGIDFEDIKVDRKVRRDGNSRTVVHETTWEGNRAY